MIAFDGAALPEEERMLLDVLGRQPGWKVWPANTSVDATLRDFTVRFSADRSPVIVTPTRPDGYPFVLAAFVWSCVRFGPRDFWLADILNRPDLWQRLAMTDYLKRWSALQQWIHLAPADLLDLAATTAAELRPGVHTDDDAHRAAQTLQTTVTSAQQYTRLSGFLTHLDAPQRLIAAAMLDAGAEIDVFWGPEQMDVWRLTLRRGDATVGFGIERGISDGVVVDHRRLRDRGARDGWTSYGDLWLVWAVRTGAIPHAVDPTTTHTAAAYDAWPAVLDWLDTASDADLTAIDALVLATREMHRAKYRSRRRDVAEAERIALAERAILRG
jgi:hypothetical protein